MKNDLESLTNTFQVALKRLDECYVANNLSCVSRVMMQFTWWLLAPSFTFALLLDRGTGSTDALSWTRSHLGRPAKANKHDVIFRSVLLSLFLSMKLIMKDKYFFYLKRKKKKKKREIKFHTC